MPRGTEAIEHEIRIAASPEIVFNYFTDPARLVQWMGVDTTLDPRPGGVFRIVFRPTPEVARFVATAVAGGDERKARELDLSTNAVLGEFLEVEPFTRIVFTWGYEKDLFSMPPQASVVEVVLEPDGEETVLRLQHSRLPAGATDFHRAGWDTFLLRLAIAASGRDPGPDPLSAAA